MSFKVVSLCALVFLVQQCIAGKPCYRPPSCSYGSGKVTIEEIENFSYKPLCKSSVSSCKSIDIPNNGGALVVTSIGNIAPSGIAVASDLGLGGDVLISGELPYLTAVAFEGQFASGGAVPVSYGCGDCVAITEQIGGSVSSAGYNLPSVSSYSIPSIGSYTLPTYSCGCKY